MELGRYNKIPGSMASSGSVTLLFVGEQRVMFKDADDDEISWSIAEFKRRYAKAPTFFQMGTVYRHKMNPGVTYKCQDTYMNGDEKFAVLFWQRGTDGGIIGCYESEYKNFQVA